MTAKPTNGKLVLRKADKQELSTWHDELKQEAVEAAANERLAINRLSLRGGKWSLGGETAFKRDPIVVIADFVVEKAYYADAFDPNVLASPTCYALARTDENMVPHPSVVEKQSPTCATCPKNVFGSANTGTGKAKACKDQRRLLVIILSDPMTGEFINNLDDAPIVNLNLPPTSLRNWANYVHALKNNYERPPFGVVTRLHLDPDMQYPVVEFVFAEEIDDSGLINLIKKTRLSSREALLQPYPARGDGEQPAPARSMARIGKPQRRLRSDDPNEPPF